MSITRGLSPRLPRECELEPNPAFYGLNVRFLWVTKKKLTNTTYQVANTRRTLIFYSLTSLPSHRKHSLPFKLSKHLERRSSSGHNEVASRGILPAFR